MSGKDAAEKLIAEGNRAEDAGRLQEACELYRQAVASAPGFAKAHVNLGIALEGSGDTAGAIACYERALASEPADPYANYNLGKLLYTRGTLPVAAQLLEKALRHRPEFPEARIMLGHVLEAQGSLESAAAQFEAALRQRPDEFGALYHYGRVLRELNRLDEAQGALRRALGADPDNVEAHAAMFQVLEAKGDLAGAASALQSVLAQRPDWPEALYNHGRILMSLQKDDEAESALRRVIALAPGFLLAYRMLGNLLHRHGRVEEMLELCSAGRARHPESFDLESFELLLLNFVDELPADALFARHRAFGERLESAYPRRFALPAERAAAGRRLRVGYVSGDFNYHPVGLFMLPVLERHDRERFETYCYATSTKSDDFTRRLAERAHVWRDARALSEAQLADAIYRDRIDILVDLSGHSGVSRLGVFAQQPAPVQAAWLGYLNTTGLSRIRYRITDAYCDPPGVGDYLHTETLIRLPHSQWCYRPFVTVAHAPRPPLERNGHVTFGSFNQTAKLSHSARSLWAQILNALPNSRLVVLGVGKGRAADDLLRDLADAGIAAARITIVPFVPVQEYLRWFDAVDIALDTMPYSGGTTTCDALWMGVPVVTSPGLRPVSRSAASILTSVGLTDWIAPSAEEYVGRALRFAGEPPALADLRRTLRERMRASPLMDEERFARDLEEAYGRMWAVQGW